MLRKGFSVEAFHECLEEYADLSIIAVDTTSRGVCDALDLQVLITVNRYGTLESHTLPTFQKKPIMHVTSTRGGAHAAQPQAGTRAQRGPKLGRR